MINTQTFRDIVSKMKPWLNVEPFETKVEAVYQKHQIESSIYVSAAICLVAGTAFGVMVVMQLLQPEASRHQNAYTTILRGSTSLFLIYTALRIYFIPESTDETGKRLFRMFLILALVYPVILLGRPLNAPATTELALASLLYCSSFSFRLNYQKYKVFFSLAVLGYLISFFLFRGAFAPSGPIAPIFDFAIRVPKDFVPLFQFLQAAGLSYLIYRFSDARERRLFVSEQKIASSNNARLHLLQSVGHDLRQPMTSILLQQGIAVEAAKKNNQPLLFESLFVIESSLQTMSAELDQLTEIAALQSDEFELEISDAQLIPLVERALLPFRAQADLKNIQISVEFEKDLSTLFVATNSSVLIGVLINLLSNAIKYSKIATQSFAPVLSINITKFSGNRIRISLRDNGVGISEENLVNIWRPFFQVGNPERSRVKGYGLGLTHVEVAIARLAGHEISCCSTLQIGTVFNIDLPMSQSNPIARPELPDAVKSAFGGQQLDGIVLVVDDDSTVRRTFVTALNGLGFKTADFGTIANACGFIRATQLKIAVAVVDFRLPDGIGSVIFDLLAKNSLDSVVETPRMICVSGDGLLPNDLALEFQGLVIIRKPLTLQQLCAAVEGV